MTGSGPLGRKPAGTFNFKPPSPGQALYLEPTPKRIRVIVGGETIVEHGRSTRVDEREIVARVREAVGGFPALGDAGQPADAHRELRGSAVPAGSV